MNGTYATLLAFEGSVVFVSGVIIAVTAARNPGVVLYSQTVALAGAGLATGGLAAALVAAGIRKPASVLVITAAAAFVGAGWRLAVDSIDESDEVYVTGTSEGATRGFEERR